MSEVDEGEEVAETQSENANKMPCQFKENREVFKKIKNGIPLSDEDYGEIHQKYVAEAASAPPSFQIPVSTLADKEFRAIMAEQYEAELTVENVCAKLFRPEDDISEQVYCHHKERPKRPPPDPCFPEEDLFLPCHPPFTPTTQVCADPKMDHFYKLGTHAEDLWKTNTLTDLSIEVGGQTYAVHRAVITCYSPYIKKKFLQCSNPATIRLIRLMGMEPEALEVLLEFMYTGDFNPPSNIFYDVMVAATKLQMTDAIEKCLQCLNGTDKDLTKHLFIYNVAKRLCLTDKYITALTVLTNRFEETVLLDKFVQLDVESIIELLSSDTLGCRSEVIVFMAALRWLDYDYCERKSEEAHVMSCVRFSSMTMEEAIACFLPPIRPEVIENPDVRILLLSGLCYATAKTKGQEKAFEEFASPPRTLLIHGEPMELWECTTLPTSVKSCLTNMPYLSDFDELVNYCKDRLKSRCAIDRCKKFMNEDQTQICKLHGHCHPKPLNESDEAIVMFPCLPKLMGCPSLTAHQNLLLQRPSEGCSYADTPLEKEDEYLSNQYIRMECDPTALETAPGPFIVTVGGISTQALGLAKELGASSFYYDLSDDVWAKCPIELPDARHHHVALLSSRCLYIIGGYDSCCTLKKNFIPSPNFYCYNVDEKQWESLPPLRIGRAFHGACLIKNKVFVVGGRGSHTILASVEVYDPNLKKWTEQPSGGLCCPRMAAGVVAHHDQLFVVGGIAQFPGETCLHTIGDVECFDPSCRTWIRNLCTLPSPRCFVTLVICDHKLFCIGGLSHQNLSGAFASLPDVLIYDDIMKRWGKYAEMVTPRHAAACTAIGTKLYVLGGLTTKSMSSVAEVEVLDTAEHKTWKNCPPLVYPLVGHSTVLIRRQK